MSIKKLAITALFICIATTPLLAKIKIDADGTICKFWISAGTQEGHKLFFSKSIDQGETFLPAQALHAFTQEVSSFDIMSENTKFYLAYTLEDALYLTISRDAGQSFSPPSFISKGAQNPSLVSRDNLLSLAWEKEDFVTFAQSEDEGLNFKPPQEIQITGEALFSPTLSIDNLNQIQLAFFTHNPDLNLKKVAYTSTSSLEPRVLFESHDDLANLQIQPLAQGFLVAWQKEYLERRETYCSMSLDSGNNFSSEKLLEFEENLAGFYLVNDQLYAMLDIEKPTLQKLEFPLLPPPQILSPTKNTAHNSANLQLNYMAEGNDPLLCKIEFAEQETFAEDTTWSFEQLITPTQEVIQYSLPVPIPEGTYFLRIYTLDGLTTSSPSQITELKVDNTPPQIVTLEAKRSGGSIVLMGEVNESPAFLSINGNAISLETETQFQTQLTLEAGQNLFTFILTDEAGNQSLTTEEAFYDPTCPEISLLKPLTSDWFKSDSTIIIEAGISDLQDDIEEESEASITINNQLLEETLVYDPEEKTISGFISIPPDLRDGSHSASITLSDKSGNAGEIDFILNIDGSPPQITQDPNQPCFTNSSTSLKIPVIEEGAGFDVAGSLITMAGVSIEGTVSSESEEIIITLDSSLSEGSYEVSVAPRDMIGNIGEDVSLSLIVDQTPPELTISGSYESNTDQAEIMIEGEIEETHPASITIYNNHKEIENFTLNSLYFSKNISLFPGSNEILIEAHDQAGNKSSKSIHVFANIQATSTLLSNAANGPNPFSPTSNTSMYFTYTLSGTANLTIYIFDIAGNLVWKKEIQNTTSGNTPWNGVDHYGIQVNNGVYPYIICASSGGTREIRRGKIIILR